MSRRSFWPAVLCAVALALAGCGGGGTVSPPDPTPCPPAPGVPDPGAGTTLRGFVFEGSDLHGRFSGRPLACVVVIVESGGNQIERVTDERGFFDIGTTPTEYTIHFLPPPAAQAAAMSVFDLHTATSGQILRAYLPLRRAADSPSPRDPGTTAQSAVVGILLNSAGNLQVGAFPIGGSPGDPGSVGFVWWGTYRKGRSGPNWMFSGITDNAGRFDLWADMGGQILGRTLPFFAGNYDGSSMVGVSVRHRHYTEFAYRPAVDALAGSPANLGDVRMEKVTGRLTLRYDAAARAVLASWGSNGLGFTYINANIAIGAEHLEVAQAFNGPRQGGTEINQVVPVPEVVRPGAAAQHFYALSFAFDATVTDGTGELSLTHSLHVGGGSTGNLDISYLAPPRNFALDMPRRTFAWSSLPEATIYAVSVRDPQNRVVWLGIRGAGQNSISMPFALPPGVYFAWVHADETSRPASWVSGQERAAPPNPALLRDSPRTALRAWRPALHNTSFPSNMVRNSFSRTIVFVVR